jgi:hypothetical protein
MSSIADSSVPIQTSSRSVPCPPSWWGEVVLISRYLVKLGVLHGISERVHLSWRRFGHYEVIDFLAVLFGYAGSSERTLEAFYEVLRPWASTFMALFGRDRLPACSTLSRFLKSLTEAPTEALRALFLADVLARPLDKERHTGELLDRCGGSWYVFDIDGTREAARQRALPRGADLPAAHRRLDELCARGSTGRKRGEVVRTRTVVSQAHSSQWLGSFGNRGNGHYRKELHRALSTIESYLAAFHLPKEWALVRLDGQYGTGMVLWDLTGFSFVTRGKDYSVLDQEAVAVRLHLPADQSFSHPESDLVRPLYDCPDVPIGTSGVRGRVIVATHPAGKTKSRVGIERNGVVYELFFTNLPKDAFTAADVVALYLHRGAFEPHLSDEDQEQDPDRWCSHAPAGQEVWTIIAQWIWNLRLELGHQLEPAEVRTTEFAPALQQVKAPEQPLAGYGPPTLSAPWKAGRLSGEHFALQSDGTVRCPAGKSLFAKARRREQGGSLRIVYEARIADCRSCELRAQCQWYGKHTQHPRRMSVLLHPLHVGPAPLLWKDWGAASIGVPVCSSCAINGSRSLPRRLPPPVRTRRRPRSFPAHSGPIRGSRGKNAWPAMSAFQPLAHPSSRCLVCRTTSPSLWASRLASQPRLCQQARFSARSSSPLRAPRAVFWLRLCFEVSPLLLVLLRFSMILPACLPVLSLALIPRLLQ